MEEVVYAMFMEWLKEDMPYLDITSEIIPETVEVKAAIIAKEDCIVSFVEEVEKILKRLGLKVHLYKHNGDYVRRDDTIMVLEGEAKKILEVERTLLNVIGRASGVATITRKLVEEAKKLNSKVTIAATRKTTPGLRLLEKVAVKTGGGDPHRLGLSDMVLIKDNHLKIVGSISKAVKIAREKAGFTKKVEVEVEKLEEAVEAVRAGADIVMLDNMTPKEVEETVKALKREGLRDKVIVEVSGGITLENLREYVSAGIDVVSLGSITRHARILDFTLEILEVKKK